jgi:hypothetical protein
MSTNFGQVLAEVLREQVRDVAPPAVGLADRARTTARRHRRRQAVSALGAAVAVVLAVVLLPAALGSGSHRRAEPLPAGPREVTLSVDDVPTTRIDATALSTGPDPATAYIGSRILHRTDGRSLQLPRGALGAVETPDGGALVTGGTAAAPTVTVVDVNGHSGPTVPASRPVVAPDGQVAYVDVEQRRVVRLEPGRPGDAVAAPLPVDGLQLVGFLGDDLVVDTPSGSARVVRRDGSWVPVPGLPLATATDPLSGTLALRSRNGSCLELRRGAALLWRTCANAGRFTSIVAISSDGHRVLLRRDRSGHPGTSEYAVAVTETGLVLRLFAATGATLGLGQAAFEGDDVLFSAYHDADARIVRCTVQGRCEATAGRPGASPTPFMPVWFP